MEGLIALYLALHTCNHVNLIGFEATLKVNRHVPPCPTSHQCTCGCNKQLTDRAAELTSAITMLKALVAPMVCPRGMENGLHQAALI